MRKNKFGSYIIFGALLGGIVSLFDRETRDEVVRKSNKTITSIRYYKDNPTVLKSKMQNKVEHYQSIYEQISDDASYIKEKVDELKQLSPQVKEIVTETKDTFIESKDEYKHIVNEQAVVEAQFDK